MADSGPPFHRIPIEDLHKALADHLEKEQFLRVQKMLSAMHPAEIAALITGLSGTERSRVFDLSPAEVQHEVLAELAEDDQEHVLKCLSDERIAEILLLLESDDATDIAALLDEPTRERVLEATPHEERREVEQLLEYDEETAGGLMAVELVTVGSGRTVRDGIEALQAARQKGLADFYYVYAVDPDRTLRGRVALVDLLLADRGAPLLDILDKDMVVVTENMDQEDVARLFTRYDLISAPVVDEHNRLVGRITVDDVVDVIAEEAEEDLGYLTGTGEEEVTERSLVSSARSRFPWLLIALIGELVGAWVVYHYKATIEQRAVIAIFIPVMIAMGGAVGIQSSTIVVRGLATREILPQRILVRLFREIAVACMSGLVLAAVLVGLIIAWSEGGGVLASALGTSLIAVISIAAFVGTVIPFALSALKQDPALASGPFITMTNDVLGLAVYLLITSAFLG